MRDRLTAAAADQPAGMSMQTARATFARHWSDAALHSSAFTMTTSGITAGELQNVDRLGALLRTSPNSSPCDMIGLPPARPAPPPPFSPRPPIP